MTRLSTTKPAAPLLTLLMTALLAVVLTAATVLAATTPAHACSIAPSFIVTSEHLLAGDFNAPDSQLAQDYHAWFGSESADLQVLGVYVYETIHTVEPHGDTSRGSVSVVTQMWGEWPTDMSAKAISPQERSGEPPSTCGWGPSGRPMGTRTYALVTTDELVEMEPAARQDEVLTAAFGAPAIAERDLTLEQELIAQIEAPSGTSTLIFVGVGVAAIGGAAAVMYMARRSRSGAGNGSTPAEDDR